MAWNIEWKQPHKKKYCSLKNTYRVDRKVKTDYIYLGQEEVATRILADLAVKELIEEEDITYSGEMILKKSPSRGNFTFNLVP